MVNSDSTQNQRPATYRNPWHQPSRHEYGPAFYETSAKPVQYRGYAIFHRIAFDVVKDGCCVGQYHGINGARQFVDKLLGEGDRELVKFAQDRVAEYF